MVTAVFTAGMGTIVTVIPRGWGQRCGDTMGMGTDCGIPAIMGTKFCQLIHTTKSELIRCKFSTTKLVIVKNMLLKHTQLYYMDTLHRPIL